ncbi:hypothetical protein SNE40_000031 [Patella caerulea]|uniref:C2H2-type domain-containing protein n=1 Tax=Patella caerulea TaxID=87958 RepID=A0AAN8KDI9_PATCE
MFTCPFCDDKFTNASNGKRHIRNIHKIQTFKKKRRSGLKYNTSRRIGDLSTEPAPVLSTIPVPFSTNPEKSSEKSTTTTTTVFKDSQVEARPPAEWIRPFESRPKFIYINGYKHLLSVENQCFKTTAMEEIPQHNQPSTDPST